MTSKKVKKTSIKDLIQEFKLANTKGIDEAKKLIKRVSIEVIVDKIRASSNTKEIGQLLDVIDHYPWEYPSKILAKIESKEFVTKILKSHNADGCSHLLESIEIISEKKGIEVFEEIPMKKFIELVESSKGFYDIFKVLKILAEFSDSKLNSMLNYLEPTIDKAISKSTNIQEINEFLYVFYSYNNEYTLGILKKINLQTLVDLIRKEEFPEIIAGTIETIGEISEEIVLNLLDEIEPDLIMKLKTAREAGDITDNLEVINDISSERSLRIFHEISTESFIEIIEKEEYLRSINGLFVRIKFLFEEEAKKLLESVDIETIVSKISNTKDVNIVLEFIENIEMISKNYYKQLAKEIDVKFYKENGRVIRHPTDY